MVLGEIKKNTRDIVGRRAVWADHMQRSSGTGSRPEGAALPAAGFQGYEGPSERLKFHYHVGTVTGPAEALTQNDRGAFVRALEAEMVGAENDLMNNLSRQAVQGGSTVQSGSTTVSRFGAIARLASGSGNAVLVLAPDTTRAQVRFLFVGQVIDVITTTSGAVLAAGRTITAIDRSDPAAVEVSVSGANITRVTGDQIVVSGSYDAEFGGLPYLINDAAGDGAQLVHGLSSTAVPNWASNVVGSPTTPISEDLLEEMKEVIENDGDGRRDQARIYVLSSPQRRALANKLVALKRYTPAESVTPKAGFKGLDVADGVAVTDKYALDNSIFLFNPEELEWFVGLDFGVEDRYGSVLQPAADGSDAFTFRIRAYTTLAAPNRNSHSRANVQPVS